MYELIYSKGQKLIEGHLKMGEKNAWEDIDANNKYIVKNKEPWIPVMGEMQFSRLNSACWEEEILKAKALGINIISTYIFWIHHEEIEGEIDFSGNRNLRRFVQLCQKYGMYVFLRLGPWVHGEARNGGFPDWLLKKDFEPRENDEKYLKTVTNYYKALAEQVKGLTFRDNGNIIGIQLDNELPDNAEHLLKLKQIAIEVGITAPIYTVTGWGGQGGAQIPQKEVIPAFGGYADAPWERHLKQMEPNSHFFFLHIRNDCDIGKDLILLHTRNENKNPIDYSLYPFVTCELGGGICPTHHRRPVVSADDVAAMALVKLGCGCNLLGYYVFHGGSNPVGKLSTMNESKESNYPNDVPMISYDFEAPISEFGVIRKSARLLKSINLFLNDFGNILAPMDSIIPENNITDRYNTEDLRYSARTNGSGGFLFVNNYQRQSRLSSHTNVKFKIKLENETIEFPTEGIDIRNGVYFFFPFNFDMNGLLLKHSTTQLLCKSKDTFFFFAPDGVKPEYVMDKKDVAGISGAPFLSDGNQILVNHLKPGIDCIFNVTKTDGSIVHIVTLTSDQAVSLYKFGNAIYISHADMFCNDEKITLYRLGNNDLSYYGYEDGKFTKKETIVDKQPNELPCFENDSLELNAKYSKELFLDGEKPTKTFEIILPEDHEHAYLKIDYIGDVAQIYDNDRLYADDFYTGESWYVSLRNVVSSKITLAFSLLKGDAIYLETDKKNGLTLNKIELLREYRSEITPKV